MRGQTAGIIAFAGISLILLLVPPVQGAQITNAFSKILVDGIQVLTAKSYNDYLNFVGGTGIDVSYSSPNTITITSTAGPGGDTNTAQIGDEGTHLSLFGSRFNATKNLLKTITCTGATCSSNATDILIAVSASGGNASSLNDLANVSNVNQTKGNIFFANGSQWTGLKVGSNNQVLTADSSTATGLKWSTVSSSLKVDNQTAQADRFLMGLNNATGDWTTKIFSIDNQTQNKKQFIQAINNVTGTITRLQFGINNQTVSKDFQIVGINNSTGMITRNQFSINNVATTCSGSDKVSAVSIDNATGYVVVTCSAVTASGGAVVLAANVTGGTKPSADTLIWDIPLTANSGNAISGRVVATSSISGNAVQLGANVTVPSRTSGYCMITQVSTATANALDNIVMNTVTTGRATNTGETAWIAAANRPLPITFDCALKSGATTPGSLRLWFNPEIASTTIQIKAGSFYIKGP